MMMFHSFSVSSLLTAILITVCVTPSFADEVCPVSSDGTSGTCLTGDTNNVCCGGPEGGCMWAGSQCCNNGYWCAEGSFCSTTDPTQVALGAVSCCKDAACSTTVEAQENIIYDLQYGYGTPTGAPTSTFTGQGAAATGSGVETQTTASEGSGNTASTSTAKTTPSSVSTSASPTASKSAGQATKRVDIMVGLYLAPLVIVLFGVGVAL